MDAKSGYGSSFNELKINTRKQLNFYPQVNSKKYIKLLVKSVLKRKKITASDKFFWPNGLLAISLEFSHRVDGNKMDLQSLKKYYNSWIKKGLPMNNADYAINGYSLIYLYNITNDKKYLKAIKALVDYLKSHRKTSKGSLPYRESNQNRVFVDNLGMVSPFLCRYGDMYEDRSSIDLAIAQLTNFLECGMDKKSGLPYHGYDSENNMKLGIIGWGRAVGWLLMGLADSLEFIPRSHEKYQYLCDEFKKIVSKVVKYQNNNGHFAWQLSAIEGNIDSSSTSMICYAIRRGIMLGILPDSYIQDTNLALNALLKITKNGVVQECSAECRGLGMYPQIYGNYPWAQGPTTSLAAISID